MNIVSCHRGFSSFLFAERDETSVSCFALCLSKLEREICFGLISRSFCGHTLNSSVASDLFRCQEDVKPLRVPVVCLLNQ